MLVISTLVIVNVLKCCWSFKCMLKESVSVSVYWPFIYSVSDQYQHLQCRAPLLLPLCCSLLVP